MSPAATCAALPATGIPAIARRQTATGRSPHSELRPLGDVGAAQRAVRLQTEVLLRYVPSDTGRTPLLTLDAR